MSATLTKVQIKKTLIEAAKAHHEFETNYLNGVRHKQWAWWYAAYVLGRLGTITKPTTLTKWLEEVSTEGKWFNNAAAYLFNNINGKLQ